MVVPNPDIIASLLRKSADVIRWDEINETEDTVYTGIPCTRGSEVGGLMRQFQHVSTSKDSSIVIMAYLFNGTPLEILPDDTIVIDGEKYVVAATPNNAESLNHHWEIRVEHVKTAGQ